MSKVPAHLQTKQKSQLDKKKEAEKSRAEALAEAILEDEKQESLNEVNNESNNESNNELNNESYDKSYSANTSDLLASILKPTKRKTKEKANVYLKEDTMNKLRTLSIQTDKSITAIVEELLDEILKDTEIDEAAVKKYKKKNKVRSNKSKKED